MTPIRETIARAILYEAMPHVNAWELVGRTGGRTALTKPTPSSAPSTLRG
jgi:hypothetical protein